MAALTSRSVTTATSVALRWDGWWYVHVARDGYSSSLRPAIVGVHHRFSDWAFFPLFPEVMRGVHDVARLPYAAAGFVVSTVAGLGAIRSVYALGQRDGGPDVGRGASLLVAAWPGSAVFGLPYSEGLFIVATAVALWALMQERWLLAGLAGAVASATRATGVAVVAAAAVTAVASAWRARQVRPLVAPALSGLGLAAFLLYGWAHAGDLFAWRHAENLWAQRFDLGKDMYVRWGIALAHGGRGIGGALIEMVGMLALIAFVTAAWLRRRSLSLPMAVYAGGAIVLMLGYSAVGSRPRMVLGVVPGFLWLASVMRPRTVVMVAVVCLPVLLMTTYLWMSQLAVP